MLRVITLGCGELSKFPKIIMQELHYNAHAIIWIIERGYIRRSLLTPDQIYEAMDDYRRSTIVLAFEDKYITVKMVELLNDIGISVIEKLSTFNRRARHELLR